MFQAGLSSNSLPTLQTGVGLIKALAISKQIIDTEGSVTLVGY
ncbi:hypothetical protein CGMCC3_g5795 [Colletotrichum fructicola]|nr:uncharacterized protein CGMCC3_g5795 [Colletotrichum fructicola]KAE9577986.1 hypothetical protein CGMCC3_g5795 [Colletotrichum fructicola]